MTEFGGDMSNSATWGEMKYGNRKQKYIAENWLFAQTTHAVGQIFNSACG